MIRPSLLRILVPAVLFLALQAEAATPFERHGTLTVSGKSVLGQHGNVAQLRGMSMYWSQAKVGRDFYNEGVVNTLATDWNTDIVRAALAVEGDWSVGEKGYLSDPTGNKDRVKKVVDAAIAKGMYVIIDWHDHNALSHQSQAVSFFDEMSRNYGSKPNVIFEIFNEPLDVPWASIKTYANALISTIRKNSDNLVIVGNPKWDTELIQVAKDPITGQKNIVYAFHMYASESWHHDHYMARADSAINMGLPLFVSEWGLTPASGNGSINFSWVDQFWSWMESKKLSSCAWSVSDAAETSAALRSVTWNSDGSAKHNVSTTGGWSESDLTEGGKWLRSKFRSIVPIGVSPKRNAPRNLRVRSAQDGISLELGREHDGKRLTLLDARGTVREVRTVRDGRVDGLSLQSGLHLAKLDEGETFAFVVP